ncbi:MAG: rhamnogalacturonan endolyase YesW [Cyclobacteriaceae bacterium]|nr:MAG: rhamnogalacturonan endolyase YesW [Cyclobacteriaceae bacterium]
MFKLTNFLLLGATLLAFYNAGIAQIAENIDRGVVALSAADQNIFVSWRLLSTDPEDITFNIYRRNIGFEDYVKINPQPIAGVTNYIDNTTALGFAYQYQIKSISNGKETDEKGEAYVFANGGDQPWYSIKLKDQVTLKRLGVGDLDGDGAYDFVIQHPDYNVDPYYRPGYWKRSPEPYKLEAYSSQGKYLWTYDMGWAIETGTWYAPYMVFDIDGDGSAEVYTKAGEGDPRERDGRVLRGEEKMVKLNGRSGKIDRETDWLSKDKFDSYNRWSRNFLTVAYLDGENPSLIQQRGTYTIIKTRALDRSLNEIWYWESSGKDEKYRGQGQHGIMCADIDQDGKDELVFGTSALDDDGTPLWYTGLGHNDVGYIADIDPSRPGLEIFYGLETPAPKNGACLVDAKTGEIIWGYEGSTVHVHSQGMIGDIDPDHDGIECYAGEAKEGDKYFLYSAKGERLSDQNLWDLAPRAVWWDHDELKEVNYNDRLFKYKGDTLLNLEGKVLLVADIIGDWREEIVTSLPGELRIYSTNIPTSRKKVCLMQDRQYRLGVADATMGYFYPPQLGLKP